MKTEDKCYYCKKEGLVEDFLDPYTKEYHPTCKNCATEHMTFIKERKAFANTVYSLLILCSIVSFIFVGWGVGLGFTAIAIISFIISNYGLKYYIKKRDKRFGKY